VVLMVGHVLLFHPAIRKIKELIDAGKIGKLEYVYSNRLNLGTVRTEENILWSFAPHDISIFQYFIGAPPLTVESRGAAFLQPHIHDSTLTILAYPNNVVGHIFVSWLHPFKEHRLVVIGSKGMLSYEDSSDAKDILFYEKGIDWIQGEPRSARARRKSSLRPQGPADRGAGVFVTRLDGRPPESADGRNGVEILEILERATTSLLAPTAGSLPPRRRCGTKAGSSSIPQASWTTARRSAPARRSGIIPTCSPARGSGGIARWDRTSISATTSTSAAT